MESPAHAGTALWLQSEPFQPESQVQTNGDAQYPFPLHPLHSAVARVEARWGKEGVITFGQPLPTSPPHSPVKQPTPVQPLWHVAH